MIWRESPWEEIEDEHSRNASSGAGGAIDSATASRRDPAAGCNQHGLRDAGSSACRNPRPVAGAFDGGFGDCLSFGCADSQGGGALRLSHTASPADTLPAVAEYRFEP